MNLVPLRLSQGQAFAVHGLDRYIPEHEQQKLQTFAVREGDR
jgi:hypothetical protein